MDDTSLPPGFQLEEAGGPQAPAPAADDSGLPPGFQLEGEAPKAGIGETLAATAEGAARGLAGPLAPMAEKRAGVSYKSQRERAEAHPIAHGVGETGALIGGMLTGTGEGALISKAGEAASLGAGLGKASYAARTGSAAVGQAAEMAVMQGSDEVAKRIMNDPGATAETALTNIGMAAALGAGGGVFMEGVANPLWKTVVGPKVTAGLEMLTSKYSKEGAVAATKAADLEAQTGLLIPNELKAVVNGEPVAQRALSDLEQNDAAWAGRKMQETVGNFRQSAGDKVIQTLGRDPAALEHMEPVNKYESGRSMGEAIHSDLKPEVESIGKRYDEFDNAAGSQEVKDGWHSQMGDAVAQYIDEKGLQKAVNTAPGPLKLANGVIQDLENQKTVGDLKKLITNLRNSHPYGSESYQTAKDLANIIKEHQEQIIMRNLGPDALGEYQVLRKDYANLMNKIDSIDQHMPAGRYDGPQSYLKALQEKTTAKGEQIVDQLNGAKRADVLEQLKQFPNALEKVKQYHIDSMLEKAVKSAGPRENVNINNLLKSIENASPQVKALIASPEQHQAIKGVDQILESLKDPNHNWSNTARKVQKDMHGAPSVLSLIAGISGHMEAGVLSFLGKLGFTEGKAAAKLGMLKFMGSDQPIKAEGFKAMMGYINAAYKGDMQMTRSIGNVLKPGAQVLLDSQMPKAAVLEKLNKVAAQQQNQPDVAMKQQAGGDVGHYLPNHQAALSQSIAQVSQYINAKRPMPVRLSPLDRPIEPTEAQNAAFQRTLTIAAAPATVLEHIKDGTVQLTDLQDLKAMYPSLYSRMAQDLSNHMINRHEEEEPIPYKTRMGLSLFLGEAVDSSMQPANIMAAQPMPKEPPQSPAQGGKAKGSPSKLKEKNAKAYQTPDQAAQSDRTAGRTD